MLDSASLVTARSAGNRPGGRSAWGRHRLQRFVGGASSTGRSYFFVARIGWFGIPTFLVPNRQTVRKARRAEGLGQCWDTKPSVRMPVSDVIHQRKRCDCDPQVTAHNTTIVISNRPTVSMRMCVFYLWWPLRPSGWPCPSAIRFLRSVRTRPMPSLSMRSRYEPESDGHLQDVYIAMAYGMFPFCVQDDAVTRTLFFRRSTTTTEKDKTQRLSDAAQALQSCPDIVWYNASQGMDNAAPLHVQIGHALKRINACVRPPGSLSVAWAVDQHSTGWRCMHPPHSDSFAHTPTHRSGVAPMDAVER